MQIRVTKHHSWTPEHTWGPNSVDIDGRLDDGRAVDISTFDDFDSVTAADRSAATHAWLHGGLHVITDDVHNQPPRLVIPVSSLNESAIAEAIRRWLTPTQAAA